MIRKFVFNTFVCATAATIVTGRTVGVRAATTLLNMSYDPARELYEEVNTEFTKKWRAEAGEDITLCASYGGSGRQARSMIGELDADVVTLVLGYGIDAIAEKGLTDRDWQKRLPHNTSPYASIIVFLVCKGNPKSIGGWNDLIKPGIAVTTPNPKTFGEVHWGYLVAQAYVLEQPGSSDTTAKDLVQKLYENMPVPDSGTHGATTTFTERGIDGVLITWEDGALLATYVEDKDKLGVVVPSVSILAGLLAAVVDKVVDEKGAHKAAEAYLKFLCTPQDQEIGAKNFYRPTNLAVAKKHESELPKVKLVTIDGTFDGQQKAQKTYFAGGGQFGQLYQLGKQGPKRRNNIG